MKKATHFGFESVTPTEKTRRVHHVFQRVAPRYDLMNDIMSGGLHRWWKKKFVEGLPLVALPSLPSAPAHILDMASGTGDIARRIGQRLLHLNEIHIHKKLEIELTLCDLTEEMLQEGRKRLLADFPTFPLKWVCGNAEALPLPDNSVDLYTIAFGLRNVTSPEKALAEAYRVLKPGGFFFCLEFSHVTSPLLSGLYEAYSFHLIPCFGAWIAQDRPAYQYLIESIRKFPSQKILLSLLEEAGFIKTHFDNLSGGIVAIHTGEKRLAETS